MINFMVWNDPCYPSNAYTSATIQIQVRQRKRNGKMNVLVINCGSSSIKYQVVDTGSKKQVAGGRVERVNERAGGHGRALQEILAELDLGAIEAVGHRVVHGGDRFSASVIIDDDVIDAIGDCEKFAPLHNPANLAGIRAARDLLPDLAHVAVFDTAFHSRMPGRSKHYALPADIAACYKIRRYGFHGTSHACVAARAAVFLRQPLENLRLISCHLGNGASVCAVEYGHSVDTSLGMTPLEGLVMGTRCGDVDPGVVVQLCRELGVEQTEHLLNHKSGLAGLSGIGNDMRDIVAQAARGSEPARLAIAVFAHRARKYIGAFSAVMAGVDAVLLTGGIGENSAVIRQRILQRFDYLGLSLDVDKNHDADVSESHPVADISSRHSRVRALVIATNEQLAIAEETQRLLQIPHAAQIPKPIPIAISARHVHLDRRTMDLLFGQGSRLEILKEISQPGQFAAKQTVNLIGPRDRIDGVRILGPLRKANQIEIARTDEFRLGVDAPIRKSGQVANSAPITLEGPKGTVRLHEGLICARRHIHMAPMDAEAYGVENGDEVEVEITGSPRDLTFGDVLVRVSENYRLEMHIDTDEANAAELNPGDQGELVYSTPDTPANASVLRLH
jgi:acetate kinase